MIDAEKKQIDGARQSVAISKNILRNYGFFLGKK
jgi:hypothetical protein